MRSLVPRRFTDDEQAASPVVGNLLLVGIVVILGATVTVLAFGYIDSLESPPPQSAFSGSFTEDGTLEIAHTQGDTVAAEALVILVSDPSGQQRLGTWATLAGSTADVVAGDTITASGFNGDETVSVVWDPPSQDGTQILSSFETRAVAAPLSSATVSENTGGFASQTGAFGSRAWQSLARIGDSGTWELSTSQDDQPDNAGQQADYTWQNGPAVPFTLRYDQNGNGEASLTVDGQTAVADTTTYPATGDTIGVTLRVVNPSTMAVSVSDLRLDGLRLQNDAASTGSDATVNLLINDDSIADGFVLTGSVSFGWSGARPDDSQMQLNIEVEESGTGSS